MSVRRRKWTTEELKKAVNDSKSIRQVIYKLGLKPAGGNYAQLHKYISELGIDIGHFQGQAWNRGLKGIGKPQIPLESILVLGSTFQSYKLKKRLFLENLKYPVCEECSWAKQSPDGRVPLELDHINGNSQDNRLENLRVLCPNCHSLKPTHRGRNRRSLYGITRS